MKVGGRRVSGLGFGGARKLGRVLVGLPVMKRSGVWVAGIRFSSE